MKTLLLAIAILAFIACQKEEIKTGHTIKYIIDCNPAGFDINLTNNDGDTLKTSTNDIHWEYNFQSYAGKELYIKVTAKNKKVTNFQMFIYHNDSLFTYIGYCWSIDIPCLSAKFKVPK